MNERRIGACVLFLGLLLAAAPAIVPTGATESQPAGPAAAGPCWARLNDVPTDYPTVQAAVDASTSPTDVVKVAGYCTGVAQRAGMTQTVYLSKTLTLQGGYTVTNWTVPDPVAHPTTLDAAGLGRVLLVYGDIRPAVAGLRITGGDATKAGADPYGQNRGGGAYILSATAMISDCTVFRNSADSGGGLYTFASALTLRGSTFTTNTAALIGGGMLMYEGAGRLEGNAFISNTAGVGAGAYFGSEAVTLTANAFLSNTALYDGGGVIVEVYGGHSMLVGNTMFGNRAYWNGGGLYFGEGVRSGHSSDHLLFSGNLVTHNWARNDGGGVFMSGDGGAADFVGNTVQENEAGGDGGGLYLDWSADPTPILSNTVSGNIAYGRGGGIYLGTATATVQGNIVQDNLAWGDGGGGYGRGNWSANTFSSNESLGRGGGLFGGGTLVHNVAVSNTAHTTGGGVFLHTGPTLVVENSVMSNEAIDGGGIGLDSNPITLTANVIAFNEAGKCGGGLALYQSNAPMQSNVIASNEAGRGGGLCLDEQSDAALVNNWIVGNWAFYDGSGLLVTGSSPRLAHNTIARNTGDNGLYVQSSLEYTSAVALSDTILLSHTVGIVVEAGNSARLEATLWGNDTDWTGAGSIYTGTVNVWGDPAFLDPAGGDYHIGANSAALDAGVPAGIGTDIDGDPRPVGAGYDIGADEAAARLAVAKYAAPDPVAAGRPLTYTLYLTNTGAFTLHAALTDTLPAYITPTGVLTWSANLAPGDLWTRTIVVAVEPGYAGPLVNWIQATTEEGAAGQAGVTVTAVVPIAGLSAANDSPTVLGLPTTLSATILAGSDVTYSWTLGDGDATHGAVVVHVYPSVGLYTAAVTASDAVSQVAATTAVLVVPRGRIYLPLVVR